MATPSRRAGYFVTFLVTQEDEKLLLGVDTELPEYRAEMVPDCVCTEVQLGCNRADSLPAGETNNDLPLTLRQLAHSRDAQDVNGRFRFSHDAGALYLGRDTSERRLQVPHSLARTSLGHFASARGREHQTPRAVANPADGDVHCDAFPCRQQSNPGRDIIDLRRRPGEREQQTGHVVGMGDRGHRDTVAERIAQMLGLAGEPTDPPPVIEHGDHARRVAAVSDRPINSIAERSQDRVIRRTGQVMRDPQSQARAVEPDHPRSDRHFDNGAVRTVPTLPPHLGAIDNARRGRSRDRLRVFSLVGGDQVEANIGVRADQLSRMWRQHDEARGRKLDEADRIRRAANSLPPGLEAAKVNADLNLAPSNGDGGFRLNDVAVPQ